MMDFCSVADAAAHFGASARTVERLMRDGRLRSRRVGGGRLVAWTDIWALEGVQPGHAACAEHMRPLLSLEEARDVLGAPTLEATLDLLAQRRVPLIEIGRLRRVSRPALRAAQERGA